MGEEEKQVEDGVEYLTRIRIRRPPLRFSSYHCGPLPSLSGSGSTPENYPSLRNRKSLNYNEDKLFINSIVTSVKLMRNTSKQKENKDSNVSTITHHSESITSKSNVSAIRHDSESVTPKSSTKNNKRNHISSVIDSETDSGTDSKVVKAKSMKKSSKLVDSTNDKLNEPPKTKETPTTQDLSPIILKIVGQKMVIPKTSKRDVPRVDNNDDNEEEFQPNRCKNINFYSVENTTPVKMDKQKRTISGNAQKNVEFVGKNKSDNEEEGLADMYKRIKISSAKKSTATPQKRSIARKSTATQLVETHLSTPKSRSVKRNLTPSMGKRSSTLLKAATPLQEARSRLHVSAVPKSLPCREEEFNNIFTFLRGKLVDKSGGCIYISGVPGTGKTATVNEAVRCLQKLIIKGQLDDFDYVSINGMKLTEPRQSYVQILKQLDGRTGTWEQAYHILETKFRRANSKMTLLLVDELDFLCTKRQDVVYNLLDWPTKATAQLVVVTIANTMDLPERVLMGRVTSRLGLTRLTFQPYNFKQLQEIVMSRLKDFSGFRSEAVQLVARKVSAVSGDARRALDICRRAMEIAELRDAETISLTDVTEAVSEMIASAKVQAIKHCSKMEQTFLQAMSAEVTRTSIEEVYFKDAYRQLESLCSFNGIKVPTITETLAVCGRLGASRLLICEHSRNDIYQKILLNVSTDDIHYATQELDINSK
ncbi:origin recognition complex subunit 1 [Andrena cerasifolii]|uniref:origin recognition complex subunit 1 n=1 Tax=Andrena cerasifolii TaxID=2819439 RepID=UPI00403822D3